AEVSLLGSHDLIVFTDNEGRYAFRELPPGSYKLTASHTGFVSASSAAPYILDSGESREHVDFRLSRGGTLVVNVADEHGDPIAVTIVAWNQRWGSDGLARSGPFRPGPYSGTTDEHGWGRLDALAAGSYYVAVTRELDSLPA